MAVFMSPFFFSSPLIPMASPNMDPEQNVSRDLGEETPGSVLRWLECCPDTPKVAGSTPSQGTYKKQPMDA